MGEQNPKVSIVMPVYNAGRFLREAINDIRAQTYENWELICVDDGSTDQSLLVLEYFAEKDDRIRIITQENRGAGVARNVGMATADGKYLLFLDSDDRFEPNLLEDTVQRAEETGAEIVVYSAKKFDSETGMIEDIVFPAFVLNTSLIPNKEVFSCEDCADRIFQMAASVPWNKLYRTEFVKTTGIRYQEQPYNNDSFFACTTMVMADRIVALSKPMVYYREGNSDSLSQIENKRKNPQCNFEMFIAIKKQMIDLCLYERVWKSLAILASSQVFLQVMMVDEQTYKTVFRYWDKDYFLALRMDKLKKEDYESGDTYQDIQVFLERGREAFVARMMGRLSNAVISGNRQYYNLRSQRDEDKKKDAYFSNDGVLQDRKVILYGAGECGKRRYKDWQKRPTYDLVGWVDQNAREIRRVGEMPIFPPSAIPGWSYDYILIAIDDVAVMLEVKCALQDSGVREEQIVW